MLYTFDATQAFDPTNPAIVAADADILIHAPNDPALTPLPLWDTTGAQLPNPYRTNELGAMPAFTAEIERVGWSGGGLTGFLTSWEGLKSEAVAAANAAAASESELIESATIVGEDLVMVRRSGEVLNLGNVRGGAKGDPGEPGQPGPQGLPGTNAVPADEAVAGYVSTAGTSATKTAVVALVDNKVGGRVATLEADKWYRGNLTSSAANLDTLNTDAHQGMWRVTSTTVQNTPLAGLGFVEVRRNSADGRITQLFSQSIPGVPVRFVRVYNGGAWGPWINDGWFRRLLGGTVDLNTVTDPGLHGIQTSSQPNAPVAKVGTLEVLPSTGLALQRFTTWEAVPEVYQRRQSSSTGTWNAWVKIPSVTDTDLLAGRIGALESAPTPSPDGAGQAFSVPTRAPLAASTATATPKSASQIMASMSKDRLRGWNCNTANVSETRDEGATWTVLTDKAGANPFAGSTVESVRQMGNGELLVSCQRGSNARRELWVSQNLDDPTQRMFVKTLTARAPFIKFTSAWSQSDSGPIVLVNEYGPKTPTWTGETVVEGENARHTYLSTDYGNTWAIVFDLNAYLTGVQGRVSVENQHLHGVAWDPYWDRIWVTFGDNMGGNGSNGIVYSDDLGATWETAHYYSGTNPPHQCVGIQPMPKCVLFFTDNVSPGYPDVVRIDRTEGRQKAGGYPTVAAWESTASGKHLCQGFTRIARRGDDAPALAAFCAEGAAAPSFAVATMDGYTFTEIWRDSVENPSGMGSRSIVGPTIRGNVIISSNDQKVAGMWSEIKTEAPGY